MQNSRPYELADATDGVITPAEDARLEQKMTARIPRRSGKLLLTYTPEGVGRDDGWHKLTVVLKGKKGKVRAAPATRGRVKR